MGLTSLQVCMDSSDWLQGNMHDDGMDSSSPSGDMLEACSRPPALMERRLRPPHDQALKCPRCDSSHTKFCYYNNYSLSQPRYFCKTCRRYWTKGGTLRNIPVGGGCRKNKKVATKKSSDIGRSSSTGGVIIPGSTSSHHSINHNQTDLHLSFPEMQLSHLSNLNLNLLGGNTGINPSFDFMESKLEAIVGASSSGNYDHFNQELGIVEPNGLGDHMGHLAATNYHHGLCYGMPMDHGSALTDTCQRLMLPYDANVNEDQNAAVDVKPNPKLLTLDWHDRDEGGKNNNNFGYMNNLQGSWNGGMMNGY